MFSRKLAILGLGTLMLAACGGGGDDAAPGPQSVVEVVKDQIASNTTESAVPIMINDLPLSDAGTDETSSPIAI